MIKHVNVKERKKGCTNHAKKIRRYSHRTKRSNVIPTAQKDPQLSHKGVEMFRNTYESTRQFGSA